MIGTVAIIHRGVVCDELVPWLRALPRDVHLMRERGYEIAAQRNTAVRAMRGAWLLFIDSDSVPTHRTLDRLLEYERPVIGATIIDRRSHTVCATKTFEPTVRLTLDEVALERGAIAVLAVGTGCLLVRRRVFEALREPWFTCGQLVNDCITEDTEFCLRAAEVGYPSYLACDVRVGHVVSGVVWPSDDGVPRVQWDGFEYAESVEALA